jgi:hypothetical protein
MTDVLKQIARDVYLNDDKELCKDDIFEVLQTIRPGCRFDATLENGTINFQHYWDPNNLPAPTLEEVVDEINYQKDCKDYYQYAYDRCQEYPDGFEQFDMLWHAINNGVDLKQSDWFISIKAIKDKYPKPDGNPPVKENK